MNKRQREAAERVMLKHILDTSPYLKKIVDDMVDNPPNDVKDAITPVLQAKFKEQRDIGILIGWSAFALRASKDIEKFTSIDEIKQYFIDEHNKTQEKLGVTDPTIEGD